MDLESFYDKYVDKVYKFFYVKSLDRMTAEDLTSQTFMAFLEKIETTGMQDRKTYLYGIMRNTWIAFLRDKYKAAIDTLEDVEDFGEYTESEIDSFEQIDGGAKGRLLSYLEKLPEKQRQVVTMRIIDDLSVKEVAETLGTDKNYVKTTHQRGLRRLREMLDAPYQEVSL